MEQNIELQMLNLYIPSCLTSRSVKIDGKTNKNVFNTEPAKTDLGLKSKSSVISVSLQVRPGDL
jgi:hypothetical protein